MERINFYVDGFNLYHGLKQTKEIDGDWKKFYWLDYVKLFQHFIGENQVLQKVYYFTAPPLDLPGSNRQSMLFEANKLLNGNRFEIVKGQFYRKEVTCKVCKSKYTISEEKRTDVNIAVRLLGDCAINSVDTLVLVSADSDFIPPLEFIRDNHPEKKLKVFFPPNNYSGAIVDFMRSIRSKLIRLEKNKVKFQNSIMPDVVAKDGVSFTIPQKWKVT